ncbi:PAS domain-containing protein [Nostoc sp. CMAA1605]|uniref:PAS domain-containing protein n=1 Tax=Nostoc sp. CMAA1605 TaxID=2055159 RepID=UPI001F436A41|nr:PAS domain-containing protein [Nostoc sp. CMAA1605]MCF4970540.1 hybrid sensor histidine kinase/response regulator [Nostoc sp. CMAA1605]
MSQQEQSNVSEAASAFYQPEELHNLQSQWIGTNEFTNTTSLQQVIEYAPVAMVIFDQQMRYLHVSRRWLEDYQLTDDIIGCSHYEVFPDIPPKWRQLFQRCLAGEMLQCDEDTYPRADGTVEWVSWMLRPWHQPNGEIGGIMMFSENITKRKQTAIEQKQTEDALRESNTLLRSILESTPDIIVVKDNEGRHVALNSYLASFFGKPIDEIIGKTDYELFPQEIADKIMAKDIQIINQGITETFEEDHISHDGQIRGTFLTTKSPWRDAQGNILGMIGISRNINDRKKSEMLLAQAKEAAEAASYAKSEFLANMSHELRTPLNGILGYAQILQRSKHIKEEERSRIDVIYQCGSHLLTLINDILDLSKIEARKVELLPTDFHFPAFLQSVAEMCRIRAELKGIQFNYQFASELPIGITADEKRLRQVLINLLSNATKFTDTGSVNFTVSYASPGKIRFEVRDTGTGIPQDKLQAIFQPFEQAGDNRRQTEGTGLGLAISQKIVEFMGSEIKVHSAIGIGSIFWFDVELPTADEWVKTSQTDDYGQIIGIKGYQPKIVIVDDKWANRSVLANLLSPIGFEIKEAVNGEDGWQKILEFQPDLVITDLLMPELDGFLLIQRIRQSEAFKDIVIIVSSASVFESDQHRSLEVGGNDFLPKPIQAIDLFQKIRKYLNLEWLYEQPEIVKQSTENLEIIAPPPAEIATIYELVMKGNFKGIIKQAVLLEETDQKYLPFAKKLQQLAKNFQDQEILSLIQSYQ